MYYIFNSVQKTYKVTEHHVRDCCHHMNLDYRQGTFCSANWPIVASSDPIVILIEYPFSFQYEFNNNDVPGTFVELSDGTNVDFQISFLSPHRKPWLSI